MSFGVITVLIVLAWIYDRNQENQRRAMIALSQQIEDNKNDRR